MIADTSGQTTSIDYIESFTSRPPCSFHWNSGAAVKLTSVTDVQWEIFYKAEERPLGPML
jgi:hypothetical protein